MEMVLYSGSVGVIGIDFLVTIASQLMSGLLKFTESRKGWPLLAEHIASVLLLN